MAFYSPENLTLLYRYPLFAFTPVESGGLGLSEAAIGVHMALRSFISLLFMLGFGRIQTRMSALRVYQWATTVWPFSVVFFPLLSTLAKENARTAVINAVIAIFFIAWGFACLCWRKLDLTSDYLYTLLKDFPSTAQRRRLFSSMMRHPTRILWLLLSCVSSFISIYEIYSPTIV